MTEKDPPESPKDKNPPPSSSAEGLASGSSKSSTVNPTKEKELTTTSSFENLDKVVDNPSSTQRKNSPSEYPPQDQINSPPHTPYDREKGLEGHSSNVVKDTSQKDPFSRFWSGQTGDISDKSKRRHRWLIRKPERRHSVELEH